VMAHAVVAQPEHVEQGVVEQRRVVGSATLAMQ
jgi:hypothetical protein